MRIYEFAQQHTISSKDIIEKLQQNGFDVKSHMSVLEDKAFAFLEKEFKKSHDKPKAATQSPSVSSQPANPIEKTVSESLSKSAPISPKKSVEKKQIGRAHV